MKNLYKFWLFSIFIGIVGISFWFYYKVPSPKIDSKYVVKSYRDKSFSGIVKNKYIDENDHKWKKIILNNKITGKDDVVLMNWETGGVFDYVQIGDTLCKKEGSLHILLKRKNLDTLIEMKFYNP